MVSKQMKKCSKQGLWGLHQGEERSKKHSQCPSPFKNNKPTCTEQAQQAELERSHTPPHATATLLLVPFDGRG